MTVSTEVDHNDYTGNGATTIFQYTFRIFQNSDLAVSVIDLDENISSLVLDTDYTITGAGGYNGGNVILAAPLADGWQISIARELPVTQDTDLRNQGSFFAEVHEDAFDKVTMLIQQVHGLFNLSLRKPSFIANWYDALNNYVRNLRDPKEPQDAATKNYVDNSFSRSLRVPENIPVLPSAINRSGKVLGTNDSGEFIFVLPPDGTATDVMVELAKTTGTSLVGSPVSSTLMGYLATATLVDPRLPPFNYKDSDDITTRTASLQSAFDYCNANQKGLALNFIADVNNLTLDGHTDYSVLGSGGIIARGEGTAAIEMINCRNVSFMPGISINNAGSFLFGLKMWGDSTTGTSLNRISLVVIDFPTAFRFGDEAYPDALCSEIVVHSGYTFNCRRVYEAYGSQTVVSFNNYQLIGQGPDSIGTNVMGIGDHWGAVVHINGGECISATDSLSQAFRSYPIDSPSYAKSYGSVYVNGAAMECAGPWFIAANPDAVSSPSAGSGAFVITACHGYASFAGVNIQVSDNFTGNIVIDESNKFHRTGLKNSSITIASNSAFPICDISDNAFDDNFPKGFQKYSGDSISSFTYRRLGIIQNLNGQNIAGSGNQTTLCFTGVSTDNINDNGFFLENYNSTTGSLTIPKGGIRDACLYIQWDTGGSHAGSILYVMLGGTQPIAELDGSLGRVNGMMAIGNLSEGDIITLVYQNGGDAFTAYTKQSDYISFFGSR